LNDQAVNIEIIIQSDLIKSYILEILVRQHLIEKEKENVKKNGNLDSYVRALRYLN
jgi:hypothetical protein